MNIAVLKRNNETAAKIEAILGLAGIEWTDCEIAASLDSPATATLTIVLTRRQFVDLAAATTPLGEAARITQDGVQS